VKRFKLLILIVFNIFLVKESYANCEAAAFRIHTVADYKIKDDKETYLLYQKGPDGSISYGLNSNDPERSFMNSEGTKITSVSFRGSKCSLDSKWSLNGKDGMCSRVNFPYSFKLNKCKNFLKSVPEKGFAVINLISGEVKFPVKLYISKNKRYELSSGDISVIQNDFKKNSTVLSRRVNGSSDEKRLSFKDVVNFSSPRSSIAKVGNQFEMIISHFKIQNLNNVYNFKGWGTEAESATTFASGRTLDFPLIHFKFNKKTPFFVGDGSWCSSRFVYIRKKKGVPQHLKSYYKYVITNAFDLNEDGFPDIIEINNSFSYKLGKDQSLSVIDRDYGCY